VVPEIGGLRPRQFQKVLVDLPAKRFRQTAYVYVPGEPSALSALRRPEPAARPGEPSGLPFPVSGARPGRRRERSRAEAPETAADEPPRPEARAQDLAPAVRDLVRELREALGRNDVEHADAITTRALLEAAGRGRNGWLRAVDGRGLPDELFTELDAAWAEFSGGAWGFRAQCERIDGLALSGPREFRRISVLFGWRGDEEETVPRYPEFARRADHGRPFHPTLRNTERERFPEWHDEWSATAMSVHVRLQSWKW
jgi:hypothetical protein